MNPQDLEQAIPLHLADLNVKPSSIRTMKHGLKRFVAFMESRGKRPFLISDLDVNVLSDFFRWLKDEGYSAATVRGYLSAASNLMKWLDVYDLLPTVAHFDRMERRIDGARGRPRVGYQRRQHDPDLMSLREYFLQVPLPEQGSRRLVVLRNRVLVPFLYDTAARINEALALTREDVGDGKATEIRLTKTKGSKPRWVFVSAETRELIRDYCRERDDGIKAPLFASHGRDRGTALTSAHAWLIIKKAAKELGLFSTTSPHSFRHARAQDLHNDGVPLELIQALLGHTSPETTRVIYAPETDRERLRQALEGIGGI